MDWWSQIAAAWEGNAAISANQNAAMAAASPSWSPPAVNFSGFDLAGTLNSVAGAVSTVANTALNWQMAKDSLAIGKVERAASLDIRKAEIAAGRDIATLQAAAAVERARAQAAPSYFSLGGAGGGSQLMGIVLLAGAAVAAYMVLRK